MDIFFQFLTWYLKFFIEEAEYAADGSYCK